MKRLTSLSDTHNLFVFLPQQLWLKSLWNLQIAKKNKEKYSQEMEAYKQKKDEEAATLRKEEEEQMKLQKQEALQLLKKKEKTENIIKVCLCCSVFF